MDYKKELFAQHTPYLQWLKCRDAAFEILDMNDTGKQIAVFPFCSYTDGVKNLIGGHDVGKNCIYLFVHEDGVLHNKACGLIAKAFLEHDKAVLVYADEDYYGTLEELYHIKEKMFGNKITSEFKSPANGLFRGEPWFKPEFSPDTLESFFCIGNIFAISGEAIAEVLDNACGDIALGVLVRELARKAVLSDDGTHGENLFVHICEPLYTNNRLSKKDELEGFEEKQNEIIKTGGVNAKLGRLSVIIPSKDNPDLLKRCIETFVQCAKSVEYELIVVDNGSSLDNRRRIGALLNDYNAQYIYRKMEFNFSRMCNIGAEASCGDFLLFLNDDIEAAKDTGWLEKMMCYAAFAHVGAVGIKLLYAHRAQRMMNLAASQHAPGAASREDFLPCPIPFNVENNGCYTIQHAGITNMGIGPAHKLCGMPDKGNLYHGHNIADYNMLAVTAACMMIAREKFKGVGGFDEELAVAYNDVELCFRLYQKGFYNVQANSVFLFHHESLSRGQDISAEKQERLLKEKQKLYEKHPWALGGFDPFYSPNLVQWERDTEYNICYHHEYDKTAELKEVSEKEKHTLFKEADFRRRLEKKSGFMGKLYSKMTGADRDMLTIDSIEKDGNIIKITGWHVLRKADNAKLTKRLLLFSPHKAYEAAIFGKLRPDAEALFANEKRRTKNTALSGICLKFDASCLDQGAYSIGIAAEYRGRARLAVSEKCISL